MVAMPTIWIDADAAPREAKEIVFRAAHRLQVPTILVANQPIDILPGYTMVRRIQVGQGANIADKYILDHAEPGDLAITADIPLAAELVARNVFTIDPRGEEYTANNVSGRLSARNWMDQLRGAGVTTGGAKPYDQRDKQAFASAFDRVLTKAVKLRQRQASAESTSPSPE